MITTSLNPEDRSKTKEITEIDAFESKPLSLEKINEIMEEYFPDYV